MYKKAHNRWLHVIINGMLVLLYILLMTTLIRWDIFLFSKGFLGIVFGIIFGAVILFLMFCHFWGHTLNYGWFHYLHYWNGCVCTICGEKRPVTDSRHMWDGCVCTVCGQHLPLTDKRHDWNGCTCQKCGDRRDEGHDWNGCTCRICRKVHDEGHDWKGRFCRICGQVNEALIDEPDYDEY